MLPEYKVCPKCKIKKSKDEYHTRKDKGYVYLKSYCKQCANKQIVKGQYDQCACGKKKTKKSRICKSCHNVNQVKYETVEECLHSSVHGQSAKFNIIRGRARSQYKHIKSCEKCGYNKHVEVCHIKPISSFSNDTKVSDINDRSNILILCPNCHWEFDHP